MIVPRVFVDASEEGRRLRELFERRSKAIESQLEAELEKQVKKVEADAVLLAPVDTGRLRSSIGTRKVDYLEYEVGSNVHYAPFVELGTKNMAPQPFLRPALDKNKEAIRRAISEAIKAGLR